MNLADVPEHRDMTRLLVHVEGETEERFVNLILAPHLYGRGYDHVGARLLGNARQRSRRGGICGWPNARHDIIGHLREDAAALATTMVDYYALPQDPVRGWPGRAEAGQLPFDLKAATVHQRLSDDMAAVLDSEYQARRFLPYVMMHEFEGLLFSDCDGFADAIGHPELAGEFQKIRNHAGSPEHINDSPHTAPSKRILGLVDDYQKPLHGSFAVERIGLDVIRRECRLFGEWLTRLERWPRIMAGAE